MGFETQVKNYILQNTDYKDRIPDDFTVERCSDSAWQTPEDENILIVGKWRGEDVDAITNERRMVYPDEGTELYQMIDNKLSEVRSRVQRNDSNVTVSSLSISPTIESSDDEDFAPEWATGIETDFRAMFIVEHEHTIDEKDYALVRQVLDAFESEISDSLLMSDYDEISLLFSDFHHCEVSTIEADIVTDVPHIYYQDVESFEEYCKARSDDDEEFEQLINQEEHTVYARLDYEDGEINNEFIPENIRANSEEFMSYRMNSLVDISSKSIYEAESIIVDPESIHTSFWVRVPVEQF